MTWKPNELTPAILAEADVIIEITQEEAAALPGFLGRSVRAHLSIHEYRAITMDGQKRLYVAKGWN